MIRDTLRDPDWRDDPVKYAKVRDVMHELAVRSSLAEVAFRRAEKPAMEQAPAEEDMDKRDIDYSPLDIPMVRGKLSELSGRDWIRLLFIAWPNARMTAYEACYIATKLQERGGVHVHDIRSLATSVYHMDKCDELVRTGLMLSRTGSRNTHRERVYGRGDNLQKVFTTRRDSRHRVGKFVRKARS